MPGLDFMRKLALRADVRLLLIGVKVTSGGGGGDGGGMRTGGGGDAGTRNERRSTDG